MAISGQERVHIDLGGDCTPLDVQTIANFASTNGQAATTTTTGVVKQAVYQTDSTAADVAAAVADFNTLLGKLQTAGIMASS